MSFSAGAICKFNCCQEGRDLPEDNSYRWINGRIEYDCCKYHYFLIISTFDENNKIHKDWSRLSSKSETEKIRVVKLCTAIPLDERDPNNTDDNLNPLVCFIRDTEYVGANPREKKELEVLKGKTNALLCNKLCRINVGQAKTDTIGFLGEDVFDRIKESIHKMLEKGKNQVKVEIKKWEN